MRRHKQHKNSDEPKYKNPDFQPQVPSGPGHRLRLAREAQGISLEQLSKSLRLAKESLILLERDDYSDGTSFTFIRGYLRSYARLVNLPADEVIQAFDDLGLIDKRPDNAVVFEGPRSVIFNEQAFRWLSYGVLIGLFLFAVYWWYENFGDQNRRLLRPLTQAEEQAPGSDELASLLERPTAMPALATLDMRFKDKCWVEVNDQTGKQLFVGMKRKGSALNLTGKGPFKVLLGNPKAVAMTFNNQPFDLAKNISKSNNRVVVG